MFVIKLISARQGGIQRTRHAIYLLIRNLARGEISDERAPDELFSASSIFKSSSPPRVLSRCLAFRKKSDRTWRESWRVPAFPFFIPGRARTNLFFNSLSERTDVRENLNGRSLSWLSQWAKLLIQTNERKWNLTFRRKLCVSWMLRISRTYRHVSRARDASDVAMKTEKWYFSCGD